VLGPDALFAGAALAATVVTYFTFLPSFIFILAGGPAIEATHGKLGFTAPLSAITAAVVGVILNLALFFAYHVLWPQGFGGHFDVISAVITVAAAIALFRFKVGVMPLLGAPFIESTHGNLKFTAPLTGITAAVVGVIVNLAVFFAYHVLWPQGLVGHFEWASALIGIAAAVALFRFKVGVIPVVLASGLVGFALTFLRPLFA